MSFRCVCLSISFSSSLNPNELIFFISLVPIFDVIMIIVFLKSTFLPRLSVSKPSSSTCRRILKISGCAFSISSKSTTEYGFLLTFSVSCPPSSYPTYPGGAPTNLERENFSIYSLISILTSESSESKRYLARALHNSVLPTPVGPKNIKLPIGLLGFFNPALVLLIAFVSLDIASS